MYMRNVEENEDVNCCVSFAFNNRTLRCTGVYLFFFFHIFAPKHRLYVLVERPRRELHKNTEAGVMCQMIFFLQRHRSEVNALRLNESKRGFDPATIK